MKWIQRWLDIIGDGKMIKYFYLVQFKCSNINHVNSEFDLGVFSTKKNANKKIENSMNKKGFIDYSKDNFEIIKFGVNFLDEKIDKSKVKLYCVFHEYTKKDEDLSYWTIFDYFPNINSAKDKVEYLKVHSRLGKKYPNNFMISEIIVDNFNSWSEGFILNKF